MTFSKVNQKKRKIGIVGIVLVSLLVIAITLAYLQSHTKEESNTFVLGEGVDIKLIEEQKSVTFSSGSSFERTATVVIPETAMAVEYVAVRVDYYVEKQDTDGNLVLTKIDNADFNTSYATLESYDLDASKTPTVTGTSVKGTKEVRDGWVTKDKYTYYYGTLDSSDNVQLMPVTAGSILHVFDKIRVNDTYDENYSYKKAKENAELKDVNNINIGTAVLKKDIRKDQLETFHTIVTAYAVQGDIDNQQAMDEFHYLFTHSTSNSS